jgi:hypothetical protein
MKMFCSYCGDSCGERSFCDETCYDEYQHDMAELQASMAEELPGVNRCDSFDEPSVFDGDF